MGQGYGEVWVKGSSLNTVLTLLEPDWLFWNMLYHWAEHCKPCRSPERLADLVQHKKNAQTQVRFGTRNKVVRPIQTGSSRKWSAVPQWIILQPVPSYNPSLINMYCGLLVSSVTHIKTLRYSAREHCSTGCNWIPCSHSATL